MKTYDMRTGRYHKSSKMAAKGMLGNLRQSDGFIRFDMAQVRRIWQQWRGYPHIARFKTMKERPAIVA